MANSNRQELTLKLYTKISAGWYHTVLYHDAGMFSGFGVGKNGELGPKMGFIKFEPAELEFPIPSIGKKEDVRVSCNAKHTLLLVDGKVYSFGASDNGRLGRAESEAQVMFPNDDKIKFVCAGPDYSIAVSENGYNLYTWGLGLYGAGDLADGGRAVLPRPELFHILDPRTNVRKKSPVVQVACGSRHTIVLCEDGEVYSWGSGRHGRLGHGHVNDVALPTLMKQFVVNYDQRIVMVAAGDCHSMALSAEGRVYTWGSGSYGRLGLGAEVDHYVPAIVPKIRYAQAIACNAFHSLAIRKPDEDGHSLFVWGGGKYGKLGITRPLDGNSNNFFPNEENQLNPVPVMFFNYSTAAGGDTLKVINAVCGFHHTVAIATDKASKKFVYAWGYAAGFRCGVEPKHKQGPCFYWPEKIDYFKDDSKINREIHSSAQIPPGLDDVNQSLKASKIACGDSHSFVLSSNKLYGWGNNSLGQLGAGFQALSPRPIPIPVNALNGALDIPVVEIACGTNFSMCITKFGDVYSWGQNEDGQLGHGDLKNAYVPRLIEGLQGTFIDKIACGHSHSAAIHSGAKGENKIFVWGANQYGQLGLGKKAAGIKKQKIPAPLITMARKTAEFETVEISLGSFHTMILYYNKIPGTTLVRSEVYTCGQGAYGQLGLEDLVDQHEPLMVDKWEKWTDDDPGIEGKCTDNFPVGIVKISAGARTSIAIHHQDKTDYMYVWGTMPGMMSGLPQLLPRLVQNNATGFVQVLTSEIKKTDTGSGEKQKPIVGIEFKKIASGRSHFLALANYDKQDAEKNVIFAWGETKYGKLGLGEANKSDDKEDKSQRADDEVPGTSKLRVVKELLTSNIQEVATYGDHSLALNAKSVVYAWGYGDLGRLGMSDGSNDAQANKSLTTPAEIPAFSQSGASSDRDRKGLDLKDLDIKFADPVKPGMVGAGLGAAMVSGNSALARAAAAKEKSLLDSKGEDNKLQRSAKRKLVGSADEERRHRETLREMKEAEESRESSFRQYLDTVKDAERHRRLLSTAILSRIEQAKRWDGAHIKVRTDTLVADRERSLSRRCMPSRRPPAPKFMAFFKDRLEQEKKSKKELPDIEPYDQILYAGQGTAPSRGNFTPISVLSPMEELLSSYHMAPCRLMNYAKKVQLELDMLTKEIAKIDERKEGKDNKESKEVKVAENVPNDASRRTFKEQSLVARNNFVDTLYSIYDTANESDQYLLEVFLSMMLIQHAATKSEEEFLLPDSLEWACWSNMFENGPSRLPIRNWLEETLTSNSESQLPNIYKGLNKPSMAKQVDDLGRRAGQLMSLWAEPNKVAMLVTNTEHAMAVLYGSLRHQRRRLESPEIGQRICYLLADIGLRMMDGKFASGKAAKSSAERDYFKLLMAMVKGKEFFRAYIIQYAGLKESDKALEVFKTKVDDSDADEKKVRDAFARLKKEEEKMADQLKSQITQRPSVQRLMDSNPLHTFNQEMYKNLLVQRSIYKRRVRQITRSALMRLSQEVNVSKAAFMEDEGNYALINYRLDPFHSDRGSPCEHCSECNLFHPLPPDKAQDKAKKANKKDAKDAKDRNEEFRLTPEQCVLLRDVLLEPEFQKISRTVSGAGAWGLIRKTLVKQKKEKEMANKSRDLSESRRYEDANRWLEEIIIKTNNVVYLGNSDVPLSRGKTLEPNILISELDTAIQVEESARERATAQMKAMKEVAVDVSKANSNNTEVVLKSLATALTSLNSEEPDPGLEASFRGNDKTTLVHIMMVNKGITVNASQAKGVVRRYAYTTMIDRGIMLPINEDPKRGAQTIPWCCFVNCSFIKDSWIYAVFLERLRFEFVTSPKMKLDQVQLKIIYIGDSGNDDLLMEDTLYISVLKQRVKWVYNLYYNYFGDNIPIKPPGGDTPPVLTFRFKCQPLLELLEDEVRPQQGEFEFDVTKVKVEIMEREGISLFVNAGQN